MSFQQSYNSNYVSTHIGSDIHCEMRYGELVMYNEHETHSEHDAEYLSNHDVSDANDSGVTSEDTEHYNDDTDNNHIDADDYLNTTNNTIQIQTTNHNEKPLSAWKAKQLKLSAAGVIKSRRDANNRERKRMNGLNEAFERLREHVPGVTNQTNKKLSKMDTLQMANIYIRHLAALLEESHLGKPAHAGID